ncbi:hypothetical protein [Zunongwangia sp. H14]|uniref:hypothetical protein n=1 Tax=Zunongwangia sp. H14 TaxID=3240792 RepID=UPI00356A3515
MVVSVNPEPQKSEFDNLLSLTIKELNSHAIKSPKKIQQLRGNKLEPYVCDIMSDLAKGTNFEGTIEEWGGQKFPDIVVDKLFGIEVKTTTQNHWKTTGNSVLESTRIEDVERIYMLFGKLGTPIEFRARAYEECLSEVVVTHSPRYLIDMNLEEGKTIFDKINTPYDTLRQKKNPIKPITKYYKSKLKPGQDLWWINQEVGEASDLIIKHYTDLSKSQKSKIRNSAMVYFPEIFGSKLTKYKRVSIWLVSRKSIVNRNIRDMFTSGGQESIIIEEKKYENVPKIFFNLVKNFNEVLEILRETSAEELSEYWEYRTSEKTKISDWIKLVSQNAKSIKDASHLNIKSILSYLIKVQ